MRFTMVDLPIVNAAALPGGRILIFRGLVDQARSPDELAGVLAHEIGHVERRHVMVAMLRRFGLGLLLGGGGTSAEYGQALLDARYSQAAESEADGWSIERLRAAGISPAPTAALFARLQREEGSIPALLAWFASHPPSAARERRFAASAQDMGPSRPALDSYQWALVRGMCAAGKKDVLPRHDRENPRLSSGKGERTLPDLH